MAPGLKVTAPASISNINCGFDILGAAMDITADEIIGRRTDAPGVSITQITGTKSNISHDPHANTAGVAIQKFMEYARIRNAGVAIEIHKKMKPGSGLGSSASSACAAVVLANALFDHPLTTEELLPLAILGEHVASRAFHADNVAPCLLGGITLVRDVRVLDVRRLSLPNGLAITLMLPEITVLTSESRGILNPHVNLKDVTRQAANLGALVLALERSDFRLMRESLVDHIIEPQRAHLIPGYYDVRDAALSEGVIACGISGSGPALFAFSENSLIAENAGVAMERTFRLYGINAECIVTTISSTGTTLQ